MSILIPHGWRTRLHILSRSHRHLSILCAAILIAGYAVATIIASTQDASRSAHDETAALRHYFAKGLREVDASPKPHDRELADWLYDLCEDMPGTAVEWELAAPTIDDFLKSGQIFEVKVQEAIEKHAGPQDQQALFNDYVVASLEPKAPRGKDARKRIETAAQRIPPAPLANEFLGHLLDDAGLDGKNREQRSAAGLARGDAQPCLYRLHRELDRSRPGRRPALELPGAIRAALRDQLRAVIERNASRSGDHPR